MKGAKLKPSTEEDGPEFSAVSKPIKKAPSKQKKRAADDEAVEAAEGGEEVLEFGLADGGSKTGTVQTPKKKQKRATKSIDSSEIPAGKITLPTGDALMEEDAAEDSAGSQDS